MRERMMELAVGKGELGDGKKSIKKSTLLAKRPGTPEGYQIVRDQEASKGCIVAYVANPKI